MLKYDEKFLIRDASYSSLAAATRCKDPAAPTKGGDGESSTK